MPHINAKSRRELIAYEPMFQAVELAMGFVPNSMLTMARVPGLLEGFAGLGMAVLGPGRLDPGLKQMIAHVASRTAGCQYCMAHTAHSAHRVGVDTDKLEAIWSYETDGRFTEGERAALRLAQLAAQVPNATTPADFEALKAHFDAETCLEIVAVISLFGFLNRWNDTLATHLEDSARMFGEAHLAQQGWQAGKHGDSSS